MTSDDAMKVSMQHSAASGTGVPPASGQMRRVHSCPRCGGRLEEDYAGKFTLEYADLDVGVQADESIVDMAESYRFLTCENSHDVMWEATRA